MLEGGIRGVHPPRHGCCCVQTRDRYCDYSKEPVLEGGCPRVVSPPGPAAVSKHETCTVTRQSTGALQCMVAFALRAGEGGNSSGNTVYLTSLCPGRREVSPRLNQHASRKHFRTRYSAAVSSARQPCCVQARQRLLRQSKGQTAESKHETHAGSNQQTHCCDQSTGHMLCQSKRHTTVSNHETHYYYIKARRRCCDAHGRRQTLLLCHSTTHQTVRALPSIEHSIHPRTQYPSPEQNALGL